MVYDQVSQPQKRLVYNGAALKKWGQTADDPGI